MDNEERLRDIILRDIQIGFAAEELVEGERVAPCLATFTIRSEKRFSDPQKVSYAEAKAEMADRIYRYLTNT